MKETMQLKRAWFGGYNRQDVQEYIDELYTDMESKYNDISEQAESVSQENHLLLQYINESDQVLESVQGLNLSVEFDNHALFNLPEGVYQVGKDQQIIDIATASKGVNDKVDLADIKEANNKKVEQTVAEEQPEPPQPTYVPEPIYPSQPPQTFKQETNTQSELRNEPIAQAEDEYLSPKNIVYEQGHYIHHGYEERHRYERIVESTKPAPAPSPKHQVKRAAKTDSELIERVSMLEEELLQLKAKLAFANDLLKDLYKQ